MHTRAGLLAFRRRTVHVELGVGGPVAVRLEALPHLLVREDVEGGKADTLYVGGWMMGPVFNEFVILRSGRDGWLVNR